MSKRSPKAHGTDVVGGGRKPLADAPITSSSTLQLKEVPGVL
eukprot:CAMPEP_0114639418 /NCGR_PEP_ID=MMETSP0191-20121206/1157_1 /TAXON_ID=126664 /ORGANISM="Sorites sp." /LENGTH=41 /DNA_ID= /DNA_START= /DNA_END= /DNA_ORIENTATION=